MNRQSIAVVILAVSFLIGSGFVAYKNTEKLQENTRWVTHTHEVLAHLNALLASLVDTETGERGYIITGEDSYLEPYNNALSRLRNELDQLKALTADNPAQQANVAELQPIIEERLVILGRGIALRRKEGFEAAQKVVLTGNGKAVMNQLRVIAARMIQAENNLLSARSVEAARSAAQSYTAIGVSTLAGLLLLAFSMRLMTRHLEERNKRETELFNHREWLRVALSSIGDAVIATDMSGMVTYVNPVAESITGWKSTEAAGQPLQRVFNIINEVTRQAALNPVQKVLLEKRVVGLANHTALIKRDGTEIPIEDSAAPIVDANGALLGVIMVFHDVTNQRKAARELYAQTERLRTTLLSIGDAVIVTDTEARVELLNPVAQKLTGWKHEEATGRGLDEIFHIVNEQTRQVVENPARRALREGGIVGLANHTVLMSKEGAQTPIDDSAAPIKDETGKVLGAVLVFRDVSVRRKTEEERADLLRCEKEARGEAERANRLKDEFLAVVSHELRTPLTPILGWTRILKSGKVNAEDVKKGFDVIERNVNAQTQVIDDLLDVSRIVSGKLHLNLMQVDLTEIVETAIETVRPSAEAKRIKLETEVDSSLPRFVSADSTRLQQVIWNLVGNAIKFTPAGGQIHVRLNVAGSQAEIEVKDSGEGIDPGFLPQLFNRFTQADSTIRREHGGLGLGLAIVRHVVEAHGGSVSAFSEGKGCGATFNVFLPLTARSPLKNELAAQTTRETGHYQRTPGLQSNEVAAAVPRIANIDHVLEKLNALVVEDDVDSLELISMTLEQVGAKVMRASSVPEALKRFNECVPNVVVSDIGLPIEDGYSFIRKIRQRPENAGGTVPAIALTAFAKPEDRNRALAAGFQMHVAKPVEPSELVAAVASVVGRLTKNA